PDVIGARIAHWLGAADFLLAGRSESEAQAFLVALGRQLRHLQRVAPRAVLQPGALSVARGLIAAGIALDGPRRALDQGRFALARAIERQVLPDGGHIERNPSRHLEALEELIAIRAMMAGAAVEVPLLLQAAIDRM